jgi:hypothetical protein
MAHDECDAITCAFYRGKDSVPGDENPYKPGSPEANAWASGFSSEWDERTPMSDDEVKAAFAKLRTPF